MRWRRTSMRVSERFPHRIIAAGPRPHRERFDGSACGPSRWLMVVVARRRRRGSSPPSLRTRKGLHAIDAVNVGSTDSSLTTRFDADGDVLYLARGTWRKPRRGTHTEGHGIRYDSEGHVIGVTIINARSLLDRDGHVTITLPQEVQVGDGDLNAALS